MKKIYLTLVAVLLLSLLCVTAQTPQGISYQAVLRNSEGQVYTNQAASIKISLTNADGSATYYSETHSVTANAHGLFTIIIGNGEEPSASFSSVPWSNGEIFLRIEAMLSGAADYTNLGTQKLQSVPYALYAADGLSIEWLGSLANHPSSPTKNQAYYNTFDKKSYLWDGDSWEIMAMDGAPGPQGIQGDVGPQGEQGIQGEPGKDGASLQWLGSFPSEPVSPNTNDAYYSTTNKTAYVWNGTSWNVLAKDGEVGPQGIQGDTGPQGTPGATGANGVSLIWLGTLDAAPASPSINHAYYNSTDKISYVYTGVTWSVLSKDGAIGAQGIQGEQGEVGTSGANGVSIQWLGSFDSAPTSPTLNQAYRNNIDKISYVWNGTWTPITYDGSKGDKGDKGDQGDQGPAGVGLNNRGSWSSSATYAISDYVFAESSSNHAVNSLWICQVAVGPTATPPKSDPSHWVEFEAPQGPAGSNGISIEWLGSYSVAPSSPSLNQAYYNSVDKISYLWDGDSWELLAKDGAQGPEGPLVAGTIGQTLRHNGTSWISNSLLYNNGTNIGINITSPTQRLDVNGAIRLRSLLYDYNYSSGTPGQYLSRGTSGVTWQTPTWLTGSGTNGTIALWNGTSTLTNLPNLLFNNSLIVLGNPTSDPDDPIFEVKNNAGEVIFGVYQQGVRVYISDGTITKGTKGGFAIGGLSGSKSPVEYLRITPDSARVYVKEVASTKGAKGGFAVGGLSGAKAVTQRDLLFVAADSTRVYVKENPTKGAKGGFAVGGLSGAKAQTNFMQLTPNNYFIGFESGLNTTTGLYNSFLGYQAGMINSTGSWNTFLGYQAGMNNSGSDNTFIGYQAGAVHQSKGGNVYIGSKAGGNAQNGQRNILIGESSGYSITTGEKNVLIGFESGYNNADGNYNVFLGTTSGRANTSGSSNVFIGIGSGYGNTSGSNNVFLGTSSGLTNTTGGYNTFLGYEAGYTNNSYYNSFVGYRAGRSNATGYYNTFFGYNAGYTNSTGSSNVFIGNESGYSNESGGSNVFLGYRTGYANTASYNIFVGREAGRYNTSGTNNSFLGYQAGYNNTIGESNIFVGNRSGRTNTEGQYNTFLGYYAGYANSVGNSNVFIGNESGRSNVNGENNVFLGYRTGYANTASNNIFVGTEAGRYNTSGYNNSFMGYQAGFNNTIGTNNIFIGNSAGLANTEGSNNVFLGPSTGASTTTGTNNVFLGTNSGYSNTLGRYNVFIGYQTGYNNVGSTTYEGNYNVFIGYVAGKANTIGQSNVFIGDRTGDSNTEGRYNTFVGKGSGTSNILGNFNTFVGAQTGEFKTGGSSNILIGNHAGAQNTSGDRNIMIGVQAGYTNTGSNNILIGYQAGYSGSYTQRLFIENNSSSNALIYGEFDNRRVSINGTAPTQTLDIVGTLRVRTVNSGTYSTPVNRTSDGTLTTATSDVRLKENIATIKNGLSSVLKLRGVSFNWKSSPESGRKIGLIAQEVEPILPELVFTNEADGFKGINYAEISAVLIEAIKEQQTIITTQNEKIDNLQKQLDELILLVKGLKTNK